MAGAATQQPLRPHSSQTSSSHHIHGGGVNSDPFRVGASVEIRIHESGFEETFFSATVISLADVSSGKIQVEYRNLLAPRSRTRLLREYVDVSCVRPQPPSEEAVGGFGPGDAVDALYQDGWWIGVVTRVVEEGSESKYIVTFHSPPDEREFGLSELRVHWDWVNGSWVRPDRQDVMVPSSEGGMEERLASENSCASMPNFSVDNFGDRENIVGKKYPFSLTRGNDKVEKLSPDSQKTPDMTPLTRRRKRLSDLRNSLSECQKKLKEGPVLVEKQQEKHDRTTQKMLSESVSPVTAENVETPGKQSDTGDLLYDNPSWRKRTRRGQNVAHKSNSTPCDIKNCSAQTIKIGNMQPGAGGKKADVVDNTAKDVRIEHVVIGSEMGISGHGQSRCKRNCSGNSKETMSNNEKKKLRDSTKKIEQIKQIELGELNERRKRGRPQKTPTESVQTPIADSVDASGEKPAKFNSTPEVNTANSEALNIELDDQPLSKWIGRTRIQYPSAVDGSRLLVDTAVEESIENRVKQADIVTALKENPQETRTHISTEHQNLPFAKTNFLWKTIESQDAFRMLPQNPHFQPLVNVKESMREGLAIGHMVNFSSVIEATSKLQFDDPKSTMYDILAMLAELETHGFNIGPVRAHVANLLAVKDKEAELGAQARELNCQISGHQLEIDEMEKEIENLKEQVRKVQKLTQLESAKMASSGSWLRETEQSIENLRLEFKGIAAADAGNV